ncbi:hypothetical protein [Saccharopolyspora shandongensis]|uniref:hypothetical protein n=1 Tax=Saccharopolyspora shandongensis TaxID=418495 RepID=UPI0033DBB258
MTRETAALAVLLRKAQWLLDDLAYEVAAGRARESDLCGVADVLDEVARLLRSESRDETPFVVDSSSEVPRTTVEPRRAGQERNLGQAP